MSMDTKKIAEEYRKVVEFSGDAFKKDDSSVKVEFLKALKEFNEMDIPKQEAASIGIHVEEGRKDVILTLSNGGSAIDFYKLIQLIQAYSDKGLSVVVKSTAEKSTGFFIASGLGEIKSLSVKSLEESMKELSDNLNELSRVQKTKKEITSVNQTGPIYNPRRSRSHSFKGKR